MVLLDELRGAAIILMVLYHAGYDLVAIFGIDFPFFYSPLLNFLRDIIAGMFIVLSGVACNLSRNNLKRGAITFLLGLLMTAATALVIPDQIIVFGILHFLGVSMMLFALLRPALEKIPPRLGGIIFALLFLVLFSLPRGSVGLFGFKMDLPIGLYGTSFLFPLGFPSPAFYSSDYYPLLPWFLLFLCGSFAGVFVRERRCPSAFYNTRVPWLAAVGRNTIYIYLLHQPIIYGLFMLIFSLL